MPGFLDQPYRERYSKKAMILIILSIGLLIHLFLLLLIPFGISPPITFLQFLFSFGYTLVTASVIFIFYFLIGPLLRMGRWNLGKSIIWELLIILSIGLANLLYHFVIHHDKFENNLPLKTKYLLVFGLGSLLIAILLIIIHYSIYLIKKRSTSLIEPATKNEEGLLWDDEVIIRAGNKKNNYILNPKNILFISSNNNYVSFSTIKGDLINKTHIRGTLKGVESDLKKYSQFARCHKCFIVNFKYVDRTIGNVQNMKLVLNQSGVQVPVSRSYVATILKKINKG